jgi:hypothetical protein
LIEHAVGLIEPFSAVSFLPPSCRGIVPAVAGYRDLMCSAGERPPQVVMAVAADEADFHTADSLRHVEMTQWGAKREGAKDAKKTKLAFMSE